MATVVSKVSIIDNSEAGTPDEFIVFLSDRSKVNAVRAVQGIYDHNVKQSRHSAIVRGYIDMRYATADVEDALKKAAGLTL